MLQIIGWMGCLYLIVKALEFLSSKDHETDGKLHGTAQAGAVIAILGAIGFFFMLNAQAEGVAAITSDFTGLFGGPDYYADASADAGAAAEAAMADAEANVDAAAAAADAAAAEAEAAAQAAMEDAGYPD